MQKILGASNIHLLAVKTDIHKSVSTVSQSSGGCALWLHEANSVTTWEVPLKMCGGVDGQYDYLTLWE